MSNNDVIINTSFLVPTTNPYPYGMHFYIPQMNTDSRTDHLES